MLVDAKGLEELHHSAFRGEVGTAPLPVGLSLSSISVCSGDNDRVFVDVESNIGFDFNGVF